MYMQVVRMISHYDLCMGQEILFRRPHFTVRVISMHYNNTYYFFDIVGIMHDKETKQEMLSLLIGFTLCTGGIKKNEFGLLFWKSLSA